MVVNLVKNGIIEYCIAVDSLNDLVEFYPEHTIVEQTGSETIGWTLNQDGTFSPP